MSQRYALTWENISKYQNLSEDFMSQCLKGTL